MTWFKSSNSLACSRLKIGPVFRVGCLVKIFQKFNSKKKSKNHFFHFLDPNFACFKDGDSHNMWTTIFTLNSSWQLWIPIPKVLPREFCESPSLDWSDSGFDCTLVHFASILSDNFLSIIFYFFWTVEYWSIKLHTYRLFCCFFA